MLRQEGGNLVSEPNQSTAEPCVFFCAARCTDQATFDRYAADAAAQRVGMAVELAVEAIERHTLPL